MNGKKGTKRKAQKPQKALHTKKLKPSSKKRNHKVADEEMPEPLRKRCLEHFHICVSKNEGKIQDLRVSLKMIDFSGGTARIFYNEELLEKQDLEDQLEEALARQAEFEEWKKDDPVKKWIKELEKKSYSSYFVNRKTVPVLKKNTVEQ